ncbi:MAG: KilA-N domain-containing protein [Deltaproteobacteria bacterium]|nr:KilA-N domain-containing protein [Deltaproteobacteria bacterium]
MKTEVEMKRVLFGEHISQKSKSEFFSATDLMRAANKKRRMEGIRDFNFSQWMKNKNTREFIDELEGEFGTVMVKGGRRGQHTWVHPLLFIDLALTISPKLKIEVYQWLFDNLIKYRNDSGDSYKLMCGALHENHKSPRTFHKVISRVALKIQSCCGVHDWQVATEKQLAKRNKIHDEIALLAGVMNNNDAAVDMAIRRAMEPPLK